MSNPETPTVERFDAVTVTPRGRRMAYGSMRADANGGYVRHADYLTLQAKCARLEKLVMTAPVAQLRMALEAAEAECERLREEVEAVREILQAAIDRDKGNESARALAAIASNAIYWRNREIARLEADFAKIVSLRWDRHECPRCASLARLHAEKEQK